MEKLRTEAQKYGIELTARELERFNTLLEELLAGNKKMNLTAIRTPAEIIIKHFLDSLVVTTVIPAETKRLLDLGTGAGFPGLPIKILRENIKVTLLDSVGKKINYLEETITKLGLGGIEALNGRAEDLGQQKNYREHYDIVTARAVALLPVLCELALPLVKIGGLFIAQKTVRAEEIASAENAILELGGKIQEIKKYTLPGTEERALIIIKKVSDTPDNFPRVYNLLTKNPL